MRDAVASGGRGEGASSARTASSRGVLAEVGRLAAAAADLLLARGCAGCGLARVLWCDECDATLTGPPYVAWPTPAPLGLPPPYTAAPYDGPVRAALLAHKEDGRLSLARPLGAGLAAAVSLGAVQSGLVRPPRSTGREAYPAGRGRLGAGTRWVGTVRLVPAPSRRAAVRARGQDATLRLARAAAAQLRTGGMDATVLPVLRTARRLADQAGLSAAGRGANLDGALRVRADLRRLVAGQVVVVVDDVMTTGSTLAEASRALQAAGADVEIVATVAATLRRAAPQ